MIRYLTISILVIIGLSSCSLKTTQGLRQIPFTQSEVENPYFSNPEIDYVYKAKIEAYGKNFGGILIIKKTGLDNHRVVFTTEFGSKLLDFEYRGEEFINRYIISDLDRKFIVAVLKEDFKLLITEKAKVLEVYEKDETSIFKTLDGDGFNFYFVENGSGDLIRLLHTTKIKEKVDIAFEPAAGNLAENIRITHNNINLSIDLQRFNQD